MADRFNMVEKEFRQDIKEIKETLSKMQVSIAILSTKQKSTFAFGSWFINIIITVIVATSTVLLGNRFHH